MKLKELAWANTSAITIGVVYLVCAFGVSAFPDFSRALAQSWFHTWNLDPLWTGASRGNFVLGLVSSMVGLWLVGYLFAWLYNRLVK